jgi:hypothetical protein
LRWLQVKRIRSRVAAILLLMHDNPAQDWQSLAENYRAMLDGELEELASSSDDLTETARQVLRGELSNRGLLEPGAPGLTVKSTDSFAASRFRSSVDPDAGGDRSDRGDESAGDDRPKEFTWKVPLCECEDEAQALAICDVLKRAGIESWYEGRGARMGNWNPRVVVAADQLKEAREIAAKPIPKEVIDSYREEVPEFEAPKCPSCGDEDPVLESAEPTNSWLCEACGRQWTEAAIDADGEAEKVRK